ncbi:uncharacterized protein LOC143452446 isoform X3 [Clavelina lepadiformis]|uniref:uncharacterized protein LOC143452446 isoform X3 n=1 Tax=Clavelina lepadiformis TaxID=159417 RepID=UPI00404312D9
MNFKNLERLPQIVMQYALQLEICYLDIVMKRVENLDEFCVHCSKTTSRSTAWYACDQCCRWIHESCSAEPAENQQFLCKHCTI